MAACQGGGGGSDGALPHLEKKVGGRLLPKQKKPFKAGFFFSKVNC